MLDKGHQKNRRALSNIDIEDFCHLISEKQP